MFTTVFTRSRHWALSWIKWIQYKHPIPLASTAMSLQLAPSLQSFQQKDSSHLIIRHKLTVAQLFVKFLNFYITRISIIVFGTPAAIRALGTFAFTHDLIKNIWNYKRAGWAVPLYARVRISATTRAILTAVSHAIPQSLEANAGLLPWLEHGRFLTNLFQSSIPSKLYRLDTDSMVKRDSTPLPSTFGTQ
jgi:hypothetical protein